MKKHKGFILFAVLLFLLLFSVLSLYSLNAVILSAKANTDVYITKRDERYANEALKQAEFEVATGVTNCLISVTSLAKLAILSEEAWQQSGCIGNLGKMRYYYVAESLGVDDCSVVDDDNNQAISAHYYRITLLAYPVHFSDKVLLQSTIILPSNQKTTCQQARRVKRGRQSWRQWTTWT